MLRYHVLQHLPVLIHTAMTTSVTLTTYTSPHALSCCRPRRTSTIPCDTQQGIIKKKYDNNFQAFTSRPSVLVSVHVVNVDELLLQRPQHGHAARRGRRHRRHRQGGGVGGG